MLIGIYSKGMCCAPKISGPIRGAHELSSHSPVPRRIGDLPAFMLVRSFGQATGVGYPKSNHYFGLDNRVLWSPLRAREFRWIDKDVETEAREAVICIEPHTLLRSPSLFSSFVTVLMISHFCKCTIYEWKRKSWPTLRYRDGKAKVRRTTAVDYGRRRIVTHVERCQSSVGDTNDGEQ